MIPKSLYLFLDETGDFDFSSKGSKFYIFSCITKERPFLFSPLLEELKFNLIEYGNYESLTHFHANSNNNFVRSRIYELLKANKNKFEIYSNVIQKNKTNPTLRAPIKFYSKMLSYLIRYVISQQDLSKYNQVIIITDRVPTSQNKTHLEGTIKRTLKDMLRDKIRYSIIHHPCMSSSGLQIVDYCCFALSRKYERNDLIYYDSIIGSLKSEFDIFKSGIVVYY